MSADPTAPPQEEPIIHLDGETYRAPGEFLTGMEILSLAGLPADDYDLYAEGHRGRRIAPEEPVEVRPGARFVTRPRP